MLFMYNSVLVLISVILFPFILLAFIIKPKLRAGFWQKIGFYSKLQNNKPTIWFHAVSVGEVNAIENLVKQTLQELSEYQLVITTVTRTGQTLADKKFTDIGVKVLYFPYDFIFSVKSALNAINPKLVVIAETEIWPTFSDEVRKHNIPLMIVNGRISPNSHKGYKKLKFFFKNILSNYSSILMQTDGDKDRIIDIGANSDIVENMGNLKFDIEANLNEFEILNLKEEFHKNENKVLIAGSTHQGEDEIILNIYTKLKKDVKNLKLIIAPRHPERLANVEKLISETKFSYGKRTLKDDFKTNDIILLDTMGELGKIYSISDIAFIGGSFSSTGGHNPLEAMIYNVPVVSGSTVFNFKAIYKELVADNACIICNTEEELQESINKLLTDNDQYTKMQNNCKNIFKNNKGAIKYALTKIKALINE